MSNWKMSLAAITLLALIGQSFVTAQERQPMAMPTPQNPQEPVKQRMPLPHTPDSPQPVLKTFRVKPLKMYNMLKRPYIATTAEGHIVYLYDDNVLTEERIIAPNIVGKYTYDRSGRFERINYSDGISIAATYGNAGELIRLASSNGRSIGFNYHRNQSGSIRPVTPMENAFEFHSAVALLRLEQEPFWWRAPAPAMENLKGDEGENGQTTSPDNPWDAPEYPHDPFPDAPKQRNFFPWLGRTMGEL